MKRARAADKKNHTPKLPRLDAAALSPRKTQNEGAGKNYYYSREISEQIQDRLNIRLSCIPTLSQAETMFFTPGCEGPRTEFIVPKSVAEIVKDLADSEKRDEFFKVIQVRYEPHVRLQLQLKHVTKVLKEKLGIKDNMEDPMRGETLQLSYNDKDNRTNLFIQRPHDHIDLYIPGNIPEIFTRLTTKGTEKYLVRIKVEYDAIVESKRRGITELEAVLNSIQTVLKTSCTLERASDPKKTEIVFGSRCYGAWSMTIPGSISEIYKTLEGSGREEYLNQVVNEYRALSRMPTFSRDAFFHFETPPPSAHPTAIEPPVAHRR